MWRETLRGDKKWVNEVWTLEMPEYWLSENDDDRDTIDTYREEGGEDTEVDDGEMRGDPEG